MEFQEITRNLNDLSKMEQVYKRFTTSFLELIYRGRLMTNDMASSFGAKIHDFLVCSENAKKVGMK